MSCKSANYPNCQVMFYHTQAPLCGDMVQVGTCFSYYRIGTTVNINDPCGGISTFSFEGDIADFSLAHYDGAHIPPDNQYRVDNIIYFEVNSERFALLLELKGEDVKHAFEQIEATIDGCCSFWNSCKVVLGFIVTSNYCPRTWMTLSEYARAKAKLLSLNGDLIVRSAAFTSDTASFLFG